jgi:L-threonylcarbamoyladenylate synthase
MERFWPGALTLTFPALASLPDAVTAGTGTVGVRIPAYTPLTALLRLAGPLTGTSANRSGAPAAETAEQLQSSFGDRIDLILDGGPTSATVPSTLVDTANTMQVLREGPISREAIEAALRAGGFLRE